MIELRRLLLIVKMLIELKELGIELRRYRRWLIG